MFTELTVVSSVSKVFPEKEYGTIVESLEINLPTLYYTFCNLQLIYVSHGKLK